MVAILKKAILLALSALLAVGAHLRPGWVYVCGGEALPACSAGAARLAERAARAAAEEICPGPFSMPPAERRLRLSLRPPGRDARPLADALLRAAEGVTVRDEVRVDGVRLGYVDDGAALREALSGYIENTLPTWACGGMLSEELSVRRLYTREGYLTPVEDMLLLVTGMAPVFYFDGMGKTARA